MSSISTSGGIFLLLERCWQNFRTFFHRNDSLFDILFLLVYFFEQLLLVYLSIIYQDKTKYIVGFFALILITTVSLQRLMMESKNRYVNEINNELRRVIDGLQANYHIIYNEYDTVTNLLKGKHYRKKL